MLYPENKVIQAFQIYTKLARDGVADAEAVQTYKADDEIRSLLDAYSNEVDCVIIRTSEQLFLVPKTKLSPFHVSNEWMKRNYLRSSATNGDIYLLYFATLILFGSFYDTYQSQEPTRQFIRLEEWIQFIQERIDQLKSHEQEELKEFEKEFSYNWSLIIEKWEDMNDIKETAKKQSGNTISRFSFIDTVKRFLIDQELIQEIGNDEIILTEKAKTIVQRFFMEVEYNKGIFEFIYGFEKREEYAID
ncbi:non-ribosomal peptide synthetase module [Bacillaceae bacterium SAOS 7]|nr:non-ribosomal peptide synthetase module [Bacillaceae bacterium SAOS 7]